jgi:hypothetical protein
LQYTNQYVITYKLKESTKEAISMSKDLLTTVELVHKAIKKLKEKNYSHVQEYCIEINRLENRIDRGFRDALGTLFDTVFGGWRIIKTLGVRLVHLRPIHGFAAETSAATIIEMASRIGLPLSTTHVISSTIMGVGASKRLSAVRWGVGGNIVLAWILTLPACGLFAWAICKGIHLWIIG